MPADHGLGSDNKKSLLQAGQKRRASAQKELVHGAEPRPGMLALQYSQLLAMRQILQQKALT